MDIIDEILPDSAYSLAYSAETLPAHQGWGRSSTFALLFNIKTKDFGKTSHETSKTYNLKYLQTIISSCSSVMFEMPAFFIRENSSLFLLMTNLRSHPSITACK